MCNRSPIKQLVKLGVIVDLRYEIHEKTIFIDEDIFWYGSLNPLSQGQTEESMLRAPVIITGQLFGILIYT